MCVTNTTGFTKPAVESPAAAAATKKHRDDSDDNNDDTVHPEDTVVGTPSSAAAVATETQEGAIETPRTQAAVDSDGNNTNNSNDDSPMRTDDEATHASDLAPGTNNNKDTPMADGVLTQATGAANQEAREDESEVDGDEEESSQAPSTVLAVKHRHQEMQERREAEARRLQRLSSHQVKRTASHTKSNSHKKRTVAVSPSESIKKKKKTGIQSFSGCNQGFLSMIASSLFNPNTLEGTLDFMIGMFEAASQAEETLRCARDQFSRTKCCAALAKAIADHADKAAMLIKCFKVIAYLTNGNEHNQSTLVSKSNAAKDVVAAMKAYPQDLELQSNACVILANLSSLRKNQNKIATADSIQALLTAMKQFPTNADLLMACCDALDNFTAPPRNQHAATICNLLWKFEGDEVLHAVFKYFRTEAAAMDDDDDEDSSKDLSDYVAVAQTVMARLFATTPPALIVPAAAAAQSQ